MKCHRCDRKMHRLGKTSAGNQRWKCPGCLKTKTENPQGVQISGRVLDAIRELPQVQARIEEDGWTEDYLIELLCRNYLGIEADYDKSDLAIVLKGGIVV